MSAGALAREPSQDWCDFWGVFPIKEQTPFCGQTLRPISRAPGLRSGVAYSIRVKTWCHVPQETLEP